MPGLEILAHWVSQPSRAVMWGCQLANCDFKFTRVTPTSGETRAPEFTQMSPSQTIPVLRDNNNGIVLSESNAILTYLADTYKWSDHWYPRPSNPHGVAVRAKINEYLHWHHTSVRYFTLAVFRPYMLSIVRGKQYDGSVIDKTHAKILKKTTRVLETRLSEHKYLCADQMSIADIACYCELDQVYLTSLYDFSGHPNLIAWMNRMKQVEGHDAARRSLMKLHALGQKKQAKL